MEKDNLKKEVEQKTTAKPKTVSAAAAAKPKTTKTTSTTAKSPAENKVSTAKPKTSSTAAKSSTKNKVSTAKPKTSSTTAKSSAENKVSTAKPDATNDDSKQPVKVVKSDSAKTAKVESSDTKTLAQDKTVVKKEEVIAPTDTNEVKTLEPKKPFSSNPDFKMQKYVWAIVGITLGFIGVFVILLFAFLGYIIQLINEILTAINPDNQQFVLDFVLPNNYYKIAAILVSALGIYFLAMAIRRLRIYANPDLSTKKTKKDDAIRCPFCGKFNPPNETVCRHCKSDLTKKVANEDDLLNSGANFKRLD